jgi:hypothetical protein
MYSWTLSRSSAVHTVFLRAKGASIGCDITEVLYHLSSNKDIFYSEKASQPTPREDFNR